MTHREELEDQVACADCGAQISRAAERGFAFGEDSVLCFACAERRGGSYDSDEDRWTSAPSLSGIRIPDDPER
ncbi:MAG: hypothetical protein FJ108_11330 [Deltaproteobacteria bacterium]|nr:hypothetical protein [Deltaproteobacteria bacterium]